MAKPKFNINDLVGGGAMPPMDAMGAGPLPAPPVSPTTPAPPAPPRKTKKGGKKSKKGQY